MAEGTLLPIKVVPCPAALVLQEQCGKGKFFHG